MEVPSDYRTGYEQARLIDQKTADNYIAHTIIGDPVMDALVEELAELPQETGSPVPQRRDGRRSSWIAERTAGTARLLRRRTGTRP